MLRLAFVTLYTPDVDRMKRWYRDHLGLPLRLDHGTWVEFDTAGATLALHPSNERYPRGIELGFVVDDVEASTRELGARGVRFDGKPYRIATGTVARFHDPEGSRLLLYAPDDEHPGGEGPLLSLGVVNCHDLHGVKAFYRNVLGLHVVKESAWWVEFDCGDSHVALHPRMPMGHVEHHHALPMSLGMTVDDLVEWADDARERGIEFMTTPHDTPFGMMADVRDPDGNILIVHEPVPEDEEIEDVTSHRDPIRKPGRTRGRATSFVVLKPDYRAPVAAPVRHKPSATTKTVATVRGAGAAGARQKPKRTADETKARSKPAIGRAKKAVARVMASKKRATAAASRGKVAKRKAAKPARAKAPVRGRTARTPAARAVTKRTVAKRTAAKGGRR